MTTPRIDAQIDLGCLFGKVHASVVGDCVGAHVEIDGNVVSDTGMYPLHDGLDAVEIARQVRKFALLAIRKAHEAIGVGFSVHAERYARTEVARALPLTPILEAMYGEGA